MSDESVNAYMDLFEHAEQRWARKRTVGNILIFQQLIFIKFIYTDNTE